MNRQFHIFHKANNLSSDQLVLISSAVNKRRLIVEEALSNLQQAIDRIGFQPTPQSKTRQKKRPEKKITIKKSAGTSSSSVSNQKALKGRVSYKVKGPDGRPMNIAEIKNKINSIYDGKPGIIKQ
ncbi:MAG TPA: hypothetical protein VFX79_02000 [Candidatus Saccharimonadales bacterium]|nr:hypothetical protein [Candidatus Saccharimonadales bacterium]